MAGKPDEGARSRRAADRNLLRFLLAWGLLPFAYFGIQGVVFNLYLLRLGFEPPFIGLLTGTGQVVWAVCALPAGMLGRRIGPRAALLGGVALGGIAPGLLLLVELFPRPFWPTWLFACWGLQWVAAALISVNNIPYALSVAGTDARHRIFPLQQAATAAMSLVGSVVAGIGPGLVVAWSGGSFADVAPYRTVLWSVPVLHLIATLALAGTRPASAVTRATVAGGQVGRPIGMLAFLGLVVFLQTAGEGATRAFFNIYLDAGLGVAPARIGALMGAAQLLPVAAALVTPRLLRHWGASGTLAFGGLGAMIALLPLAAIPTPGVAALGFSGVLMMVAINGPARNIFSQELVSPGWGSTAAAVLTIGMALGWASAAAIGGFVIDAVGFGILFAGSAALALASVVLLLIYRRVHATGAVPAVAA